LTVWWQSIIWTGFVLLAAFLMVSTWRFYSGKEINLRTRHPFRLFVMFAALLALIWFFSQYVLFIITLGYMFSGVLFRMIYSLRRKSVPPPPPPYTEASQLP
jgi:CDP-diacylglycerol---serine O-phosphatidyltransferase